MAISATRTLLAALALALPACQGADKPAADKPAETIAIDPLAPLLPVAQQLSRGIAAFIAGADLQTAFAPFPIRPGAATYAEKLRGELASAGVATAEYMSIEFELIFAAGGRDIYYLRTTILGSATRLGFFSFAGRVPSNGKVAVGSAPLAAFTGPAQPFRDTAEALLAAFKGEGCARLPFIDPEVVSHLIPDEIRRQQNHQRLTKSQMDLPAECARLAALEYDQVRLRLDDQSFMSTGADGKHRGSIKAGFTVEPGLAYGLEKFIPM